MSSQLIALYLFWRRKEKKVSKAEILEKKRQIMEANFELESDDEDNSRSRISANMNDSLRDSSFRGGTGMFNNQSEKYGYGRQSEKQVSGRSEKYEYGSQSDLQVHEEQSQPVKQKWNVINNALNDVSNDVSKGLEDRKRSRGSTTDDKKTVKSSKYKLKYDSKKYTAEKQKVIEARKAKFGIFKK